MESILSRRTSMTFLVTEKCVAKPKHLTAWSRGIPMVTSAFVKELCHGHRKSPTDPFPLYKDYVPPFDDRDFWRHTSNPKLWSTCTFLSVKNDENETLIQAAGAKIVPLYMISSSTSKTSMMDETAIQETVDRETLSAPASCFALDSRVAATKVLKQKGVPLFSAKDIAKGITQQEMLKDRQGATIGGRSSSVGTTAAAIAETEANTKNDRKRKGRNETSHGESANDNGPNKKPCPADVAQSDEHAQDTTMTTTSVLESSWMQVEEGNDTSVATTKRRNAKAKAKQVDETPAKKTNRGGTARGLDTDSSKGDNVEEDAVVDSARAKAASKPPEAAAASTAQSAEQSKVGLSEKRKPTSSKKQRPVGPKTSAKGNGWLEALPQGTKRLEHRRSNDEIREITGQDHFYQAETVKCKISKPPPGATASRPTMTVSGPDFRAFRKNNVPKQTQDAVTVRTEVTKESEHRQNLEKLREDNEAQQRRVDALFG
jgi:hypothetical protein